MYLHLHNFPKRGLENEFRLYSPLLPSSCTTAALKLHRGSATSYSVGATYCGTSLPEVYRIGPNYLTLHYRAKGPTAYQNTFSGYYVRSECDVCKMLNDMTKMNVVPRSVLLPPCSELLWLFEHFKQEDHFSGFFLVILALSLLQQ